MKPPISLTPTSFDVNNNHKVLKIIELALPKYLMPFQIDSKKANFVGVETPICL